MPLAVTATSLSGVTLPSWDSVAQALIGTPLRIAVVIAVCSAIWLFITVAISRVTKRLVDKSVAERQTVARRSEHTGDLSHVVMSQRRKARAEAIGSLLRSVTTALVVVLAILLVLAQLNINITPLLASAGVVGVALGFGAQSLVKDYLSGVFLILEDQYGVGDVVDLGVVVGTIEDVTLRVTQLRDMSGVVWYVRNGEIVRVANRSQGWTLASVDFPVPYSEDLDKVRNLVESVATDMDEDPQYDKMLLGKPMFAGVESFSDDSVTVRVTVKAMPEKQIAVTRILRERLKVTFDRAGLTVPTASAAAKPPTKPADVPDTPTPSPGQPPPKTYGTGPLKP
ncbi:MAG: mechanosensitive ion channel family protein [Actinobacteria bacterium]|nr:mechanosensitive ion channel family protein [Actinomycetota bacterium]